MRLKAAAKSQRSVLEFGWATLGAPCFHFARRNVQFEDAKCLSKCEKFRFEFDDGGLEFGEIHFLPDNGSGEFEQSHWLFDNGGFS